MGDEHDRSVDRADEVAHGRGIGSEPAERIGGGDHGEVRLEQRVDHALMRSFEGHGSNSGPGGYASVPNMTQAAKRHRISDAERHQAVTTARERFLAGDDRVRGVRPEVATSWYRCREQYHVDPSLCEAPPASAEDWSGSEHTLEHEIVFAQLGGAAASIASEVESLGGVVAVTDRAGRILTVQGDKETLVRARDSNMAPWSCWSEWATGTNGMGTALEAPGPVLISGPEHWCTGFHEWVCAGVAVRDAVTQIP